MKNQLYVKEGYLASSKSDKKYWVELQSSNGTFQLGPSFSIKSDAKMFLDSIVTAQSFQEVS